MSFLSWKPIALTILVLLGAVAFNSVVPKSNQVPKHTKFAPLRIPADPKYYDNLSKMIQFKTVSYEDESLIDLTQITGIYSYIERSFPEFWAAMEKTPIGNYSMIFRWKSNSDALPILLMSHLDVVPTGNVTWKYPPFDGHITETEIWGRGAIDDKQMVLGALASVTHLLKQNWKPTRDVYISFGFDEEISGYKGACVVADYFRSKNLKFEFIHDEGIPLLDGILPGLDKPTVPLGLAEKGSLDLDVTLTGVAGHSSIPPPTTIIGIMGRAVAALEANPIPSQLEGISRLLLEYVSPDMAYPFKSIFSNMWLFKPLILRIFESKTTTNALVRTTTAITIIKGGNKANVLPESASIHINFRIGPWDNVQTVLEHVKKVFLAIDPRFEFTILESLEPAPVTSHTSETFYKFASAIRTTFEKEILVTPGIMVGNTDTRHFWGLSDNIFRFSPNILTQELADTFHNVNERISKENLINVINFYHQLLLHFTS